MDRDYNHTEGGSKYDDFLGLQPASQRHSLVDLKELNVEANKKSENAVRLSSVEGTAMQKKATSFQVVLQQKRRNYSKLPKSLDKGSGEDLRLSQYSRVGSDV